MPQAIGLKAKPSSNACRTCRDKQRPGAFAESLRLITEMTVSIFEREPYASRGKARCIRERQTPSGMPRRLFSVETDQKVGKPQER